MELKVKTFAQLSNTELYAILKLRVDVFVVEQACPYPEIDGRDEDSLHVWLEEDGEILAYLRVLDRGVESEYVSIGRVIAARRRQGLGSEIMKAGIRVAQEHFHAEAIYLEGQVYAQGFYENLGFRQISEPYLEDNIPHIKMLLIPAAQRLN
ncbi:GNAT family N-acetyltransferase [Mobiluncus curtisii]|uniref:Acetyltransferase, GNAT family n=2 Tax=Mobiluncus curtisii TaxID=2051 RepID=D6ZHK4_MOBCV|nr:GNAT family N-acetyltransferase [Mobiluncus curtisii]ADI68112.1 acetyltransferase, GNAT family [Mobiluncus curtisii ATCC 43063]MCU9987839.1 GNAT family N-acetyltransferase [Mobiluncus curtisii]MCV0000981.1 GNAT family N-acetyltransferase [Mobiluncus curtisii]MCV0020302.1 GNAT family N-acetyltransferase [Mobiluncus curtisii]NMW48105.1 GNAT family N-acetyltransferase [Mobiluncus curtisii]